jgi:hypothetical protein
MASDCFKIFSENLVDQATIAASSENALFPVGNIQDPRRSKVYRSTSNSDNIVLDFQETSDVSAIFLVADKRAGFGVSTVTIEFNGTDYWTSPPESIVVPFSQVHNIGYVELPATISYRFARIVMTSTLGYCELSSLFIGTNLNLERSINFGWTIKDEELSQKQRNRYGQIFTDVILRQKNIGCAMRNIQKEDLALINGLLDRVGETKPFYIKLGDNTIVDDYRRFSGPVYLDDIPNITNSNFNRYNFSMSLREVT